MTKPSFLLLFLGFAVGLLAVTTASSAPPSAANPETLLKAINFALLGTDGDAYVWKSREDCVVISDAYLPNFHSIEVLHLNNIDASRIRLRPYSLTNPGGRVENYVQVELHGERVIRQYAAQLNPASAFALTVDPPDSSTDWLRESKAQLPVAPQPSGAPAPTRESSKDWTYDRETGEFDRMMRAWKYIYTHGCTGARSSF